MAKCTGVRCPMQHEYKVDECNHTDCPYRTEPITNADRIRAMSDEELAGFMSDFNLCKKPPVFEKRNKSFYKNVLDWLKQPWRNDFGTAQIQS